MNPVEQVIAAWNDVAEKYKLRRIQLFPNHRRTALRARMAEAGLEGVLAAIGKVHESRFLQGNNDRGWKATIDFILQASSFCKVLEDHYKDEELIAEKEETEQAISEYQKAREAYERQRKTPRRDPAGHDRKACDEGERPLTKH